MLRVEDVPACESGLLVIDAQNSFIALSRWRQRDTPRFEANVAALIEAFRAFARVVSAAELVAEVGRAGIVPASA